MTARTSGDHRTPHRADAGRPAGIRAASRSPPRVDPLASAAVSSRGSGVDLGSDNSRGGTRPARPRGRGGAGSGIRHRRVLVDAPDARGRRPHLGELRADPGGVGHLGCRPRSDREHPDQPAERVVAGGGHRPGRAPDRGRRGTAVWMSRRAGGSPRTCATCRCPPGRGLAHCRAPGDSPSGSTIGLETFVAVTVMFGIAAAALRGRGAHRPAVGLAALTRPDLIVAAGALALLLLGAPTCPARPRGRLPSPRSSASPARGPAGTCGRGSPSAARCRTPRGSGRRTRAGRRSSAPSGWGG